MRITVLNDDNALGLDGVFYSGLDFSTVPDNIHALQWNGTKGEIEFYEDDEGEKMPNQKITELPSWVMELKPQWDAAEQRKLLKDKEHEDALAQVAAVQAEIDAEIAAALKAQK